MKPRRAGDRALECAREHGMPCNRKSKKKKKIGAECREAKRSLPIKDTIESQRRYRWLFPSSVQQIFIEAYARQLFQHHFGHFRSSPSGNIPIPDIIAGRRTPGFSSFDSDWKLGPGQRLSLERILRYIFSMNRIVAFHQTFGIAFDVQYRSLHVTFATIRVR